MYCNMNSPSKLTTAEYINKATLKHGDEYDLSFIKYFNMCSHIEVVCYKHGKFYPTAYGFLRKSVCKACRAESRKKVFHIKNELQRKCPACENVIFYTSRALYNYDMEIKKKCSTCRTKNIINEFILLHGTQYDYSKVIFNGKTEKVEIICKQHGIFKHSPADHLDGSGCPKCKETIGERKVRFFLEKNDIPYVYQYKTEKLKNPKTKRTLSFDFFIPSKNMVIEYDGPQHFNMCRIHGHMINQLQFENIVYRDNLKNEYALNNSIKMVRIPYIKLKNVEDILQKEIYG
jgi:hypothetical protein